MGKRSRRDRQRDEKAPGREPAANPTPAPLEEPAPGEPSVEAPTPDEPSDPVEPSVVAAPAVEASVAENEARRLEAPALERPETTRPSNGLGGFLLHLHPRIRRRTLSPRATLGLGIASLVALAVVTVSGLLLLFHYVPSVERAHASLQDLVTLVPFGAFIRRLHRFSGHAVVLFALLHLLRTLLWGSYRGAHRRVWLLGALLLLCVLATSYSGYLLPWDQDAYWTVTVGSSLLRYLPLVGEPLRDLLLGGEDVGQVALTRCFVLHVALLPSLGLVLLLLHLFRLRRAGGLARGPGARGPLEETIPAAPELARRELALALAVILVLTLLSILGGLELGPAPDLARPDNPPKAPWFFVGLQELVSYSASFGGVLFPALLALILLFLPWLDGGARSDGEPLAIRGAALAIPATAILVTAATILAIRWWGDPRSGTSSWLNPASLASLVALAAAALAGLRWRDRALLCQVLLVGLLVALLVFTVVGWFWRGPDWILAWHPGPGRGVP
jgi:quinol-cytochrome oxidoreductase complex cytochrome b subunit